MNATERTARRTHTDSPPLPKPDPRLADLRFARVMGAGDWLALPPATRRRFSKRLSGGRMVAYAGEITDMRMSRAGRLLAHLLRPLGAPLPLSAEVGIPSIVTVSEDTATGGQFWTRVYGWRGRFPQVIRSAKGFAGPTGLEEYLGYGFGISLRTRVEDGTLHFDSAGYFIRAFGRRLTIPRVLVPLKLVIGHEDGAGGRFIFSLRLTVPVLGELIWQAGTFAEVTPPPPVTG